MPSRPRPRATPRPTEPERYAVLVMDPTPCGFDRGVNPVVIRRLNLRLDEAVETARLLFLSWRNTHRVLLVPMLPSETS